MSTTENNGNSNTTSSKTEKAKEMTKGFIATHKGKLGAALGIMLGIGGTVAVQAIRERSNGNNGAGMSQS